ncbi:hypothetical protein ACMZ7O_01820 [Gardnerella greenwoodii]|uniref:hypothetical protein n=1 Tax=Gardnerella greenwoodii TaxID=2914925 RepID=UPI0039EFC7A2
MFNKKAIAALAAGATLVSGLAFAAPAMAEDPFANVNLPINVPESKATKIAAAEKELKEANDALKDEQAKVPALQRTADKDQEKVEDAYKAFMKFPEDQRKAAKADGSDDASKALKSWNEAQTTAKASKTALDDQNKKVEEAQKKVNEKKEALDKLKGGNSSSTPTTPTTPKNDKKIDLINLLNGGDEPSGATMVSPLGTSTLYTNYKGLTAELIKKGITNIAAYDALLDKLEFGLKQSGWANIIKNFGGDNCAYLGKLRRQLQKAVKHYGHVEAAVKDILAELNEDYKDAKAAEDWDAAKVIKGKIAQAKGLLEVAHHNRTRAEAILDSANDHARDLSCDTGAKDVLKALKGAKADKKADKKADAKKAAPLAKTGAVVALAAVAASVLAGMGVALRKIRH